MVTYEKIISDIKNKIYHPVYFLFGDESFYIDEISDILSDTVLSDIEKEFNLTTLYGRDTNIATIINAARRFPMMANYQVIVVKEAQMLENIEELEIYLQAPVRTTILVLCYKFKKPDKRKKFYKEIDKNSVAFESPKIRDEKLPEWIRSYIAGKGYKIGIETSQLLADHIGSDLSKIANEISKLMINLPAGSEITTSYIEQNIGITKEYSIFELQNALNIKDVYKVMRIINYFASNPKENPLIKTISLLYIHFMKIMKYATLKDKSQKNAAAVIGCHPFFVKDYEYAARSYNIEKLKDTILILKEYNLKAIGVDNNSVEPGQLMKEMIFKILH